MQPHDAVQSTFGPVVTRDDRLQIAVARDGTLRIRKVPLWVVAPAVRLPECDRGVA
jgi:hypothetical protein